MYNIYVPERLLEPPEMLPDYDDDGLPLFCYCASCGSPIYMLNGDIDVCAYDPGLGGYICEQCIEERKELVY